MQSTPSLPISPPTAPILILSLEEQEELLNPWHKSKLWLNSVVISWILKKGYDSEISFYIYVKESETIWGEMKMKRVLDRNVILIEPLKKRSFLCVDNCSLGDLDFSGMGYLKKLSTHEGAYLRKKMMKHGKSRKFLAYNRYQHILPASEGSTTD